MALFDKCDGSHLILSLFVCVSSWTIRRKPHPVLDLFMIYKAFCGVVKVRPTGLEVLMWKKVLHLSYLEIRSSESFCLFLRTVYVGNVQYDYTEAIDFSLDLSQLCYSILMQSTKGPTKPLFPGSSSSRF